MGFEFPMAIPDEYGLCFVPLALAWLLNWLHTILVVRARLKYDIQYPALYAPPEHKDAEAFNCVQRAHQNFLENVHLVMISIFATGLMYPTSAFIAGTIWVLSRYIYVAYAFGNPSYRLPGVIMSHVGDFWLVGMIFRIAFQAVFDISN